MWCVRANKRTGSPINHYGAGRSFFRRESGHVFHDEMRRRLISRLPPGLRFTLSPHQQSLEPKKGLSKDDPNAQQTRSHRTFIAGPPAPPRHCTPRISDGDRANQRTTREFLQTLIKEPGMDQFCTRVMGYSWYSNLPKTEKFGHIILVNGNGREGL